jgi:hypothetical protein
MISPAQLEAKEFNIPNWIVVEYSLRVDVVHEPYQKIQY